MPITITPGPGSTLGPGFQIQVSSTITPAPPAGSQWWVYQQSADELHQWLYSVCQWVGPQPTRIVIGFSDTDQSVFIPTLEGWELQPNTRLLVQLRSPTSVVLESLSQQVVWDQTTAMPALLQLSGQQSAQAGAFTNADRTILLNVNAWLIWELVGELLPDLVELIGSRINTKPVLRLIDPDRADIGEITAPTTGPFVKWVGIVWQLIEAPPGLGIDLGNPETREIDYMQLSRCRETSAGEHLVEETFYERRWQAQWYWGMQTPSKITYYVLPGLLVRFWWLLQLEPVSESPLVTTNDS